MTLACETARIKVDKDIDKFILQLVLQHYASEMFIVHCREDRASFTQSVAVELIHKSCPLHLGCCNSRDWGSADA